MSLGRDRVRVIPVISMNIYNGMITVAGHTHSSFVALALLLWLNGTLSAYGPRGEAQSLLLLLKKTSRV